MADLRLEASRLAAEEISDIFGFGVYDTDQAGTHGESLMDFAGSYTDLDVLLKLVRRGWLKLDVWEA